jgi:hypothetical protein
MIAKLRQYSGNPDLAAVVVQLSYCITFKPPTPYVGRMREIQRQVCAEDRRAFLIPAQPYPHIDPVHLDHEGYLALGRRIGECLAEANRTGKVSWQGPRVVEARFTDASRKSVKVTFDSAKELRVLDEPLGVDKPAKPRPPGLDWRVSDARHPGYAEQVTPPAQSAPAEAAPARNDYIQPTAVRVDGLTLLLDLPEAAQPGAKVSYGLMEGDLCTLTDEHGRPAAAFVEFPVKD